MKRTNGQRPKLSLSEKLKKLEDQKKQLELRQQIQDLRQKLKAGK